MKKTKDLMILTWFLTLASIIYGQKVDTLKIQMLTDWQTDGAWFGSDYVSLKPITKFNIDGLNETEKAIAFEKTLQEGERIIFKKNNEINYSYRTYCASADQLFTELIEFRLKKGVVFTKYKIVTTEKETYSEGNTTYEVLNWTKDSITLKKKNH